MMFSDRPNVPGRYHCRQKGQTRTVFVYQSMVQAKHPLFTVEGDEYREVTDSFYDDATWYALDRLGEWLSRLDL